LAVDSREFAVEKNTKLASQNIYHADLGISRINILQRLARIERPAKPELFPRN
jgi:hypothetical protein